MNKFKWLVILVITLLAVMMATGCPAETPETTPTPPASPTVIAAPIPTDHVGRTTCFSCHETGTVGPQFPVNHIEFQDSLEVCQRCHPGP